MKKNIVSTIVVLLIHTVVFGQISTRENPISFEREVPILERSERTMRSFAPLDLERLRQEDKETRAHGMPPRFGYRHRVNYNLENSGEWTVLENGDKLWRMSIYCADAVSINLLYDKFWVPDGAKFFIYSNDRRQNIGAFTSENNRGSREAPDKFATGLIHSNHIILEYFLPENVRENGIISIEYVVHGYRHILLSENSDVSRLPEGTYYLHIEANGQTRREQIIIKR